MLIAPYDGRVYICDECIDFCNEIIAAHRSKPEPRPDIEQTASCIARGACVPASCPIRQ